MQLKFEMEWAPAQRTQNSPNNMYSRFTCSRNEKNRDTGKELRKIERDNNEMQSHINQIGLAVTSSRCEECPFTSNLHKEVYLLASTRICS